MRSQVIEKLTGSRKGHLVIGSGFYEGSENEESESLIESLSAELVRNRLLARNATLDLVLNPDSCQGLHTQAARLIQNGWTLRKPGSCHAEHTQAKLHAKYLFLAKHGGPGEVGPAQIYIGSANSAAWGSRAPLPPETSRQASSSRPIQR